MLRVVSKVDKGHLSQGAIKAIRAALGVFEGRAVVVTVEKEKKLRSLSQNAFFHGVVLPMVWELFIENGNICSTEDVKTHLKTKVGQLYKTIIEPNGEVSTILKSTRELDTIEWENWLTQIRAWAAEYQLIIPMPNELTK